jgi:hypothetical protein
MIAKDFGDKAAGNHKAHARHEAKMSSEPGNARRR